MRACRGRLSFSSRGVAVRAASSGLCPADACQPSSSPASAVGKLISWNSFLWQNGETQGGRAVFFLGGFFEREGRGGGAAGTGISSPVGGSCVRGGPLAASHVRHRLLLRFCAWRGCPGNFFGVAFLIGRYLLRSPPTSRWRLPRGGPFGSWGWILSIQEEGMHRGPPPAAPAWRRQRSFRARGRGIFGFRVKVSCFMVVGGKQIFQLRFRIEIQFDFR